MKLVLDTSGWYAVTVRSDKNYVKTKRFAEEGHQLVVLETVFEELVALLHNRHGKEIAVNTGVELRNLGVTGLGKHEEKEAWELFEKSGAKVSYVDCTVAVVAKKLDVPVFGFDGDFRKLGVEVVPAVDRLV